MDACACCRLCIHHNLGLAAPRRAYLTTLPSTTGNSPKLSEMKRTFTNFVEGLDAKERKKLLQGRVEDARLWNDSDGPSIWGERTSTDAGPQNTNNVRSAGQEEEVDNALLERLGQAIALMNEGLNTNIAVQEGTACPGVESPDDAAVSTGSSPCMPADAGAVDLVGFAGGDTPTTDLDEQVRGDGLNDTPVHGASEEREGEGKGEGEGEGDDDDEIDWEGVPLSVAICCRWPNTERTEEMRREARREMEQAAMMPLPDGDEEDDDDDDGEAGGRVNGVKWVFKRVEQGI
ncbi:hypothetical protein P171DRAFT_445447 [Karstenula rhodostoma CBS 690.94]|uniref:Uncharacterized protein n=1 Tax=Karstenula rhodostoma CBS 690.94 TaxID=1392251 RepID=A0A9P4PGG8_9PLEO|nr:hypothetical protein P171DRAFT_445447 [Karstenula rhodostoma CBS 690.94]